MNLEDFEIHETTQENRCLLNEKDLILVKKHNEQWILSGSAYQGYAKKFFKNWGDYSHFILYKYFNEGNMTNTVLHPELSSKSCYDGTQCLEAIKAQCSVEEYQGFLRGNVAKYLWRFREKGGAESLKKAQVYLQWLVDSVEGEE